MAGFSCNSLAGPGYGIARPMPAAQFPDKPGTGRLPFVGRHPEPVLERKRAVWQSRTPQLGETNSYAANEGIAASVMHAVWRLCAGPVVPPSGAGTLWRPAGTGAALPAVRGRPD